MFEGVLGTETCLERGGHRLHKISCESSRLECRQLVALGRTNENDAFLNTELGKLPTRDKCRCDRIINHQRVPCPLRQQCKGNILLRDSAGPGAPPSKTASEQ